MQNVTFIKLILLRQVCNHFLHFNNWELQVIYENRMTRPITFLGHFYRHGMEYVETKCFQQFEGFIRIWNKHIHAACLPIERWHLSNRNWLTCTSWTLSGCVGLSGSTPDWYKFIVMARPISVFQESVSQLLVKSTTVSQPLCSRGIRWKNRHVSKNPHCMYVWICVCVCAYACVCAYTKTFICSQVSISRL